MTPEGIITQLNIDGTEIAIPQGGLKSLPPNVKGQAVNYYIWAYGYDAQNENTSYARFETDELKAGDPILMLVEPTAVKKQVSFQVPVGVSADNLVLVVGGRQSATYSSYYGGFTTWINPLGAEGFDWVITDRTTGKNYGNGTFNPFGPDAPSNQGSMISFAKIGGVVEVQFDARWNNAYVSGQQLDGQVTRGFEEGPQRVPAKVFYLDVSDDSGGGYIELYHNGGLLTGSSVEAFDLKEDGSLSPVAALKVGYGGDFGYFITPGIHGKMVITVTGQVNPNSDGFSLSLYRHSGVYYLPSPSPYTPALIMFNGN